MIVERLSGKLPPRKITPQTITPWMIAPQTLAPGDNYPQGSGKKK